MCNTQNDTDRKLYGFSVDIGIDLGVVWVVEIDLISVYGGPELTRLQCRSELTWSCVGVENDSCVGGHRNLVVNS